jgi:molybdate transport system substrate-binding protein
MHVALRTVVAGLWMLVFALWASETVPARAQQPQSAPLMVFAASDLGPAFAQIVPQFETHTRIDVTLVLGSTGMLAQQIRNGAPADVFFAANESFITALAADNLTMRQTHARYARGRIATVTLASGGIRIGALKDLLNARVKRIAIANPQHAPYGLAAKQAIEAAGLWKALEPKLVFGENVQQAVQFVRSGSAEAGIVARSVAATSDLQWTLVDAALHAPLDQMAVVLARTKQQDAAMSFIAFVNGAHARVVMRQFGFLLPGESF